ncbi:MAG TPA: TRAP transporter TatT component family protein [Candidatus Methylomirabilis sp.]|nr:TRAP transporter TatT component family protein [Candidatus Methylomirabilis sp.]
MRLAVIVLLLSIASAARAELPLVMEVRASTATYHENPARLDTLRAELVETARTDPNVDSLLALAHISFAWGDIRATTREAKLDAYEQGRQAAKRAVELDPRSVLAHFWYGTNTARWGQTKGIARSLFLLPTVKQEIDTVLTLDPTFAPGYALAGNVYYEVPPLLGGDLDRAEQMFRKGLALAPRFTAMRLGLAKTLIRKGRLDEAQKELQAVLDEKAPDNLADWTMKDSRRARELLESIRGKSSASAG